jgi:peptidoglycan-N-acetylglucosamine deacetylase
MRNRWVLKLSIVLNILFISFLIFIGLKFKENTVTSLNYNEENIQSISIDSSLASYNLTTEQLEKSDFRWPEGKRMALSLTFDDAAPSQIDNGIPLLDKYGVKATFYVSLWDVEKKLEEWKSALKSGHEVGNHTCKHPCSVNYDFTKENPLEDYTLSQMSRELYSENEVLKKLLGVQPVSFAYPCGHAFVGRGLNTKSYVPLVSTIFESGRGYEGGFTNPELCDMAKLYSEPLDAKSFEQIKALIDTAANSGKWLILTGHKISDNDPHDTQMSTIEAICKYALDSSNGIWIDNVHNISSYVREKRGEGPFVQADYFKKPVNSIYSKLWSSYYVFKFKVKKLLK